MHQRSPGLNNWDIKIYYDSICQNNLILAEPELPTVVQLFVRGNPFRSSTGTTQLAQNWVKKLLKNGNLVALTIYGSPYVLEQFLAALPEHIPCIFA